MNRAIILANGQFPKRHEALQAIMQIPLLVCCDGAYNKLVDSGIFSHLATLPSIHVVGDGDSLSAQSASHALPGTVFVSNYKDQDTNDLTKAVKYAITQGVERTIILGATGLREDHTLGNISLLAQYSTMSTASGKPLAVKMYTDYGYFTPLVHACTIDLPSFPGQQVSLIPLSGMPVVSVQGLKYPLQKRTLSYWWEATLNEALHDKFTVSLQGSGSLLVYQTHLAKSIPTNT